MRKVKKNLRSPANKSSTSNQPSISSYFQGNKSTDSRGNFETTIVNNKRQKTSSRNLSSSASLSKQDSLQYDDEVIIIDDFDPSRAPPNDTTKTVQVETDVVDEPETSDIEKNSPSENSLKSANLDHETSAGISSSTESEVVLTPENEVFVDSEDDSGTSHEPYYHKHFLHMLDTVLADPENIGLFNVSDLQYIQTFKALSEQQQNMYIRIFQRKHKWNRSGNFKYSEIGDDLLPILQTLVSVGLLQDHTTLLDLGSVLKLLLLPELKVLSKHFNIGSGAKGKEHIVEAFLSHCRQQTNIKHFFNSTSVEQKVLHKAKEVVGASFKLGDEGRKVFVRVLLLFSLTGLVEDEEDSASGGQQKKLVTLLMVDKGHLKFPEYNIIKECRVFEDRDTLIRYENAKQLELDLLNAYNMKCYQEAQELYLMAKELYSEAYSSGEIERESRRPNFLQRFTSSHVYIRCLNHGIDILQKLKMYQDAVDLLWLLLRQEHFCQTYRGHWWDRLTLIIDYHLKCPKLTLSAIRQSLSDMRLRLAHEYSLRIRAQKIIEQMKKQKSKNTSETGKAKTRKSSDEDIYVIESALQARVHIEEAPKVTIFGCLLPGNQTGFKTVFVVPSNNQTGEPGDVSLLSVEELALHNYRKAGYTQGVHGEGSTIISLFCLLFWHIIYGGSVADVFRSPYQAWPLDLTTDDFYTNRKTEIDFHIQSIEMASKEELQAQVESCWEHNVGTNCLVNWDLFTGASQVKELVRAFRSDSLAGICERLAKDFRHCRSGFPDLVVWNPHSDEVKVVEVKGPKDRLSPKQVVWLHYLMQLRVPVEVCHITCDATGRKKK